MEKTLDILFYDYANPTLKSEAIKKLETEIENNRDCLKQNLDKNQEKFLLRIEDKKDLINELNNLESFSKGFKLGLKIGYESNNK